MNRKQQELFEDVLIFPAGSIYADAVELEAIVRQIDGVH